jgi:hypothetical protein
MRSSGLEPPRAVNPTRPSTSDTGARCVQEHPNRPNSTYPRTHRTHLDRRLLPQCCRAPTTSLVGRPALAPSGALEFPDAKAPSRTPAVRQRRTVAVASCDSCRAANPAPDGRTGEIRSTGSRPSQRGRTARCHARVAVAPDRCSPGRRSCGDEATIVDPSRMIAWRWARNSAPEPRRRAATSRRDSADTSDSVVGFLAVGLNRECLDLGRPFELAGVVLAAECLALGDDVLGDRPLRCEVSLENSAPPESQALHGRSEDVAPGDPSASAL